MLKFLNIRAYLMGSAQEAPAEAVSEESSEAPLCVYR